MNWLNYPPLSDKMENGVASERTVTPAVQKLKLYQN